MSLADVWGDLRANEMISLQERAAPEHGQPGDAAVEATAALLRNTQLQIEALSAFPEADNYEELKLLNHLEMLCWKRLPLNYRMKMSGAGGAPKRLAVSAMGLEFLR